MFGIKIFWATCPIVPLFCFVYSGMKSESLFTINSFFTSVLDFRLSSLPLYPYSGVRLTGFPSEKSPLPLQLSDTILLSSCTSKNEDGEHQLAIQRIEKVRLRRPFAKHVSPAPMARPGKRARLMNLVRVRSIFPQRRRL